MSDSYARNLTGSTELSLFIKNILEIDEEHQQQCKKGIRAAETELQNHYHSSTASSKNLREAVYRSNEKRAALQQQIYTELTTLPRLENDDDIRLGSGGALPKAAPEKGKNAFFIIGLPASGKSGIATKIANHTNSIIVDSDYAKRKFPEFYLHPDGSSIVHEESSLVTFYNNPDNVYGYCISNGFNIVMPRIGNSRSVVNGFAEDLHSFGYNVYLVCVDLDRQKATKRAYNRFVESHRYVPLSLIFDTFSNEPTLNYYKIKQLHPGYISGYCQISTDVDKKQNPAIIEIDHAEIIAGLY